MELNLAGIDKILIPQDPKLELDLTGINNILLPKTKSNKLVFQPEDSDWSLNKLSSVEDFFRSTFGKSLPISNIGQGSIHKKWDLDHRASADIGLNPNSKEGESLIEFLKKNNIPFLAFSEAQEGVSTGPHIHIGRPSSKINKEIKVKEKEQELNLEGIDDLLLNAKLPEEFSQSIPESRSNTAEPLNLDISGISEIQAPLDLTFALDPNKIDFKPATKKVPALLEWATRYNKPLVITKNPNEVGPIIRGQMTMIAGHRKPTVNELTDTWLDAWNPEYKALNDKFREETGGLNIAVIDSRKNYNFISGNRVEVISRPTRGIQALFEAYKNGGLREFNATNMLINNQLLDSYNQQIQVQENIEKYEKEHPYLSAIESGAQGTVKSITQLGTNIKYLGKAIATGNYYGWNSKEYLDLINQEREEQEVLAELGGTIYNPPSFTGKLISGAVQGATSLPVYVTAARVSPASLPLMAYVENLHRGNRDAALAALPMAVLVGSGRGLSKFTDINPAGSSAPFRRITQKDLSLFQDSIIKGESVSIAQLTPFERQLIHRGANALSLQIPTSDKPFEEYAANLIIGLGFPVGKSPRKIDLPNYVPVQKTKVILPIGEARIDVPLTKFSGPTLEQSALIDPNDPLASTLEKGFIATGKGQTLHLDLDTANLNLLELKRSLEEHTYRVEGDDTKTVLQKQQAIKNAIEILEKAIPDSTKKFFEENEKVIRAALRTNWEARFGKDQLLKRKEESLKPGGIKFVGNEIPKINTGKESTREIFAGKAGDQNVFTSQEKAHEILNNFFKLTTQGTLKSSLLPYGDVISNKIQDISYLSAFYIEDFYRRGVIPTVDLVLNKIRTSIGDYGRYISDERAKIIFNNGLEYYNSNVADPFFSKMKMDATEKLPNKFTHQQAIDVLSQHKDEFEWTSGLKEFLGNNKNKRINKQELIDVIQQGQIRVEESVAQEVNVERKKLLTKQSQELTRERGEYNDKILNDKMTEQEWEKLAIIDEKLENLHDELDAIREGGLPKYSLQAYQGEKLELAGAENSKEIKLISPVIRDIKTDITFRQLQDWAISNFERENLDIENVNSRMLHQRDYLIAADFFGLDIGLDDIKRLEQISVEDFDKPIIAKIKPLYQSPHWDEPNVVAHYRSNDRITTDNKRIYFGEEFQSDWAHDIREGATSVKMPFMQHNWKELVLKRFLRDAAIAKDENGNYKYDGIGWTTARQQLERYGGILEGKNFRWHKFEDGLYSFDFGRDIDNDWFYPHELQRITLDRFAELTTKEAAQEVRDQEALESSKVIEEPDSVYDTRRIASGQFSLKEAVELRSGLGTYADYDVAYKNILSKIGKRFGAKYGEKKVRIPVDEEFQEQGALPYENEKVHFLEITPSMRESLEKEGLPLFGLGQPDPLKSQEVGIRNVLTTREGFNQHRDLLMKSLEEVSNKNTESDGTVFNSGLNPDAFIDQTKLLYQGIQDFVEFTKVLVERFGNQVEPFLQDLWMEVKGIAKAFHEDERGFLNLQLRRMQTEAEKKYRISHKKVPYYDNYTIHRGIMLAQRDPMAGIVYDVMRTGQRDKNSFEAYVLDDLREANKFASKGTEQSVADNILIGNEEQKLYTNAELAAGDPTKNRPPLNPDQIEAYRNAYKAEHRNLDKRLQHVLFGYRERADRLNNRLTNFPVGSTQHTNILSQLLDIADTMKKVTDHYQHLKDSGYISLKRRGPIAAFVQDPAFPLGDKRGEIYNQFNSVKEAGIWVAEQERLLKANPTDSNIYDLNIPQRLRQASARLTPAQFEDLIDSSGVNSRSKEVEELRDEIYSRFPSKGYELKRDYVRGYDRTWQFVLESIANQTEVYANSFYSRVAGEHAIKALEATGLQTSKPDLYKVMQKYIDHEISSPEVTTSSKIFTALRKGVYLFHLGFDVNQLYLNAIAQPITQTYSYFARVNYKGKQLGPFEAEKYWIGGWNLARKVAQEKTFGKSLAPKEFLDIRERLTKEGVLTPEFNRSLLESETEKTVTRKLKRKHLIRVTEHWAGAFMRAGEITTRTHAAAEAYLVGKNKFGLKDEELVNFIVRSIDATQTNPSRAESPLLIRGSQNQGEIRKLLYQFNAFNHMWIENLALNVKSDFQRRGINATSRHLIPLVIMGGISGLPLSGLVAGLYTAITNRDPKDDFNKYIDKESTLESLALYGITQSPTFSKKLTPTVPFTENIKLEDTALETFTETFSTSTIPAISTSGQITRGFDDLLRGDKLRAAGGILPLRPLRNLATMERYRREGIKTRKGKTIVPKSKVTNIDLMMQGLGITPNRQTEYYNKVGRNKRTKIVKKLRKKTL